MQNTKDIDSMWKGTQDARHESEIKNTWVVTTRLCTYIHVRQEVQANRRSGAKESVYCTYVSTIHTVTSTFPGVSVHVVKLDIYMVRCVPTWCRSHTHASSTQNFIFLSLSLEPWSVGHERELWLRSRYTGCYNERDVISGISRLWLRGGS